MMHVRKASSTHSIRWGIPMVVLCVCLLLCVPNAAVAPSGDNLAQMDTAAQATVDTGAGLLASETARLAVVNNTAEPSGWDGFDSSLPFIVVWFLEVLGICLLAYALSFRKRRS